MPDHDTWISAIRDSHDRFTALVRPLSAEQVAQPSYDDEWSIAQVASHLGSQSEIFGLGLTAGLDGSEMAGMDVVREVWGRWDAMAPADQASESITANETFVGRLESLTPQERESFSANLFGRDIDLAGLCDMRLGEHALHTWDIAVALDPSDTIPADAVALLAPGVPGRAAFVGKPVDDAGPLVVSLSEPDLAFQLDLSPAVAVTPLESVSEVDGVLSMPAEAFVRLVAGRLDPDHTPAQVAGDERLATLRAAFPGF